MERVPIREASLRLRMSQSDIRQCIQNGELKAYREASPDGRLGWVVELPPEGWVSEAIAVELERPFTPWWWAESNKTGYVHYVESLSNSAWEELLPKFLCGISGDNVWFAEEPSQDDFCPDCLSQAKAGGLPLS